jgi:hypothetical protein
MHVPEWTPDDFRDAAREMDATGRPYLARLLREEADNRTNDTDKEN